MEDLQYPDWVRNTVLEMYRQGLSSLKIEALIGDLPTHTILRWCKKAGITRAISEAKQEYPDWMKEIVLKMHLQGFSTPKIEALTGIGHKTVWKWCKDSSINRSRSESQMGNNSGWKGDECGYIGQHIRARKDFPNPLGRCQVCEAFATCLHCNTVDFNRVNEATARARIDHSNLPYRKEYVLPMCHSCNQKHSLNQFLIFFQEGESR